MSSSALIHRAPLPRFGPHVPMIPSDPSDFGVLKSPHSIRCVVEVLARRSKIPSSCSTLIHPLVTPGGIWAVCTSIGPLGLETIAESTRSGHGTLKLPGNSVCNGQREAIISPNFRLPTRMEMSEANSKLSATWHKPTDCREFV